MKKILKKGVALLLASVFVFSSFAQVFAKSDAKDEINYVSFGASTTNGYGMQGYLPMEEIVRYNPVLRDDTNVFGYQRVPKGSYPDLVREYLEEKTGSEVELTQLAMSSMRVEELLFLLDETYEGDAYTRWRFYNEKGEGWFAQAEPEGIEVLRSVYQNSVKKADYITVDIGINNFAVYMVNRIMDGAYDSDLSAVLNSAELFWFKAAKSGLLQLAGRIAGSSVSGADLDRYADTIAYALIGFCRHFDRVIERIRELNRNAKIVVVSIQNLLDGFDLAIGDTVIPFGDIYSYLLNMANIYVAAGSDYCNEYYCADIRRDGRVTNFTDELLAYDGDPCSISGNMRDLFDLYDTSGSRVIHFSAIAHSITSGMGMDDDTAGLCEEFMTDAMMHAAIRMLAPAARQTKLNSGALFGESDDISRIFFNGSSEYGKIGFMDVIYGAAAYACEYAGRFAAQYGDGILSVTENDIEAAVREMAASMENGTDINLSELTEGLYKGYASVSESDILSVIAWIIRTDMGNSFFAHPNEQGHQEVAGAVIDALENKVRGKDIIRQELRGAMDGIRRLIIDKLAENGIDLSLITVRSSLLQAAGRGLRNAVKTIRSSVSEFVFFGAFAEVAERIGSGISRAFSFFLAR